MGVGYQDVFNTQRKPRQTDKDDLYKRLGRIFRGISTCTLGIIFRNHFSLLVADFLAHTSFINTASMKSPELVVRPHCLSVQLLEL